MGCYLSAIALADTIAIYPDLIRPSSTLKRQRSATVRVARQTIFASHWRFSSTLIAVDEHFWELHYSADSVARQKVSTFVMSRSIILGDDHIIIVVNYAVQPGQQGRLSGSAARPLQHHQRVTSAISAITSGLRNLVFIALIVMKAHSTECDIESFIVKPTVARSCHFCIYTFVFKAH
ncbi:hypothetical protein BASA50_008868 [Batrachochytrium salamandrivorans]|uniref:Uncharacterized protein n=1 Tax=Batrachochytrium salamandrivorans TaxID=1357716 RepID=A0ABQ8F263_9FUNG|nr:hypothetical protein BASA50_008868 [Batrachochytrium salamandrivorans]